MGAEVTLKIKDGTVSVLSGETIRRVMDEIETTCRIHGVKSGRVFLIRSGTGYAVKAKGEAARIEQPLMNAVNLY